MKKATTILFILTSFLIKVSADEFRLQTSCENNSFKAELIEENWIVVDKATKSEIYRIKDEGFSSMSLLISENGKSVIIINDFIIGTKLEDDKLLWIYKDGLKVKSYRFSEIVNNDCNISTSVSHITWCLENFAINSDEKTFRFSTYEMFRYDIDIETGEILSKSRPIGFDNETVIVYGYAKKSTEGDYIVEVRRTLTSNNKNDKTLKFASRNTGFENRKRLIMINNGIEITPVDYLIEPIWLNECKNKAKNNKP